MKTKTKSIILLVVIFLLGAFLGIVADRTLIEHRLRQRFVRAEDPEIMKRILFRIVQPRDEQREEIETVLDKYSKRLNSMRLSMRQETTTLLDSLKNEIEPLLTAEQKQRLEDHKQKMMRFGRPKFPFRRPGEPNLRDRFDPHNRPPAPDSFDHRDGSDWRQPPPDFPPPPEE